MGQTPSVIGQIDVFTF